MSLWAFPLRKDKGKAAVSLLPSCPAQEKSCLVRLAMLFRQWYYNVTRWISGILYHTPIKSRQGPLFLEKSITGGLL